MNVKHLVVFGPQGSGALDVARLFGDFDAESYVYQRFTSLKGPWSVTFLNSFTQYQTLFAELGGQCDVFLLVLRFSDADVEAALNLYAFLQEIAPEKLFVINSEADALDADAVRVQRALQRNQINYARILTQFDELALRDAIQ